MASPLCPSSFCSLHINIHETFLWIYQFILRPSQFEIVSYLFWQLGLVEKNILNYDFDLVVSDPSDANTNSTTLFSDDTDDKSKRSTNPEVGISVQQEQEVNVTIKYLNNARF